MFVQNTPTHTYGDEHREVMMMASQSEHCPTAALGLDSSVARMCRLDGLGYEEIFFGGTDDKSVYIVPPFPYRQSIG